MVRANVADDPGEGADPDIIAILGMGAVFPLDPERRGESHLHQSDAFAEAGRVADRRGAAEAPERARRTALS